MVSATEARFVVSDGESKTRSSWISVGDSFAGYTVDKFERETEVLTLRRGVETVELSLKLSKSPTGAASDGGNMARGLPNIWKARSAKESFRAGKIIEAKRLAEEILANPLSGQLGSPVHDSHMVLGQIALKEGRVAEAIERLLTAAKDNPGDPGSKTFGPNMSLANDLLKHGEGEAVLKYFELCRLFWTISPHGARQLDEWAAAVKAGTPPKFGANLIY